MRKAIIPACLIALLLFGGWDTHSRLETNVPADGSITPRAFERAYVDSIPIFDRITLSPEWSDTSWVYWLMANAAGKKGRLNVYGYKDTTDAVPPHYGIHIVAGPGSPKRTPVLGRFINLVLENDRAIDDWTGIHINVSPCAPDSAGPLTAINISGGSSADQLALVKLVGNGSFSGNTNLWSETQKQAWNIFAFGGKNLIKTTNGADTSFLWVMPDSIVLRARTIRFRAGSTEKVWFESPIGLDTALVITTPSFAGWSTLEATESEDTVWTSAALKPQGWGPGQYAIYDLTPYATTNGGTLTMNGTLYLKAVDPSDYFVVASSATESADIRYMWRITYVKH